MKSAKRVLSVILSFVMVLTIFQGTTVGASATVVGPDNKTQLTITQDKSEYSWGDTIVFNVDVKNVTDEVLTGIKVSTLARNYLKILQDGDSPVISRLNPGETKTVQIKYFTTKLAGIMAVFFPIIWLFYPAARIAYRESNFNYEKKIKVGIINYKIGFEVEYNCEVEGDLYDLVIDQEDFTTKDIETVISGTIEPIEGIDTISYENISENDSKDTTTKGFAVIEGNSWKIPLMLKIGKNVITVTANTLDGKNVSKTITVTYNIGQIVAPSSDEIIEEHGIEYVKGTLLIYYINSVTEEEAVDYISSLGGNVIGQNYFLNMYQVRFNINSYSDLEAKANEIEESAIIKAAIIDEMSDDTTITVNDPWNGDVNNTDWNDNDVDGSNWGVEALDIKSVWEKNDRLSKQPSRIGVVDSGINLNHQDFSNSADRVNIHLLNSDGYNFSGSDHGSHVAGIMVASPNNSVGITGINWNTDLYFGSAGTGSRSLSGSLISDNFIRAVVDGAKVVNFSLGSYDPTASRASKAKQAVLSMSSLLEKGFDFLCVQSAGNDNDDAKYNGWFCALYDGLDISYATNRFDVNDLMDHTIIVGATYNRTGNNGYYLDTGSFTGLANRTTGYSNYGSKVDIVAPGTNIYSCFYNGYGNKSGTSMAAPHVTATAGLVWSANNELTMKKVKEIICSTECTSAAYDYSRNTSYRMLNAGLAVNKAIEFADAIGSARGRFVDATNGNSISSGTYIIHKNVADGEVIDTKSFSNGEFSFSAHAGRYVLEIKGNGGYVTRFLTVVIIPYESVNCGDVPLSKELDNSQVRIVLSWGKNPSDLDSHIIGTTKSGNSFHVAYYSEYYYEDGNNVVWLDWDDTSSYGPETITIVDLNNINNFKYCVHNYSDRYDSSNDDGAFNLSDSGATVDVYRGTALIASYKVPVNRKGTVWNVFSMNSAGRISSINTMAYESIPENVG